MRIQCVLGDVSDGRLRRENAKKHTHTVSDVEKKSTRTCIHTKKRSVMK